ncbi:MAG: glutamate--cysteine ligase [Pseudonocardiales bacterium]|nr:MAG: glutamate--cysteine ligase [Pseudonocardiales bacterium]
MKIPFNASERSSLGVEWELQLVDLDTRQLTSAASEILAEISPAGDGVHPKAKHELFESTIEVITGVCGTVAEARADLALTVAEVTAAAGRRNVGLMCAGSHPTTDWATQQLSPDPRYERLIQDNQLLARQLQIFGVHCHVGVRDGAKVMPIVNALTAYIPHILALSASSPYWLGIDTGLASIRTKVFEALPTAGLPLQLADWAEFEEYMETLIQAGVIKTVREVWWDIRPHPDFGTVELRIADGLSTFDEIVAQAALAQCLVERFDGELDRGYTLPCPRPWVVRANKWRAARYGIDAEIVVNEKGTLAPVRRALGDLVEELMPVARKLDCAEELAGVHRILEVGPSYQRQRAVAAANEGDLTRVVDGLLDEMRTGLPSEHARA